MKYGFIALLLLGFLIFAPKSPAAEEDVTIKELPFDSVELFRLSSSLRGHEFSGLTISPKGKLYTASDNIWDAAIYRVDIDEADGEKAQCIPLNIDVSRLGKRAFDWEGISCLDERNFYLLNERGDGGELSCRVAHVVLTREGNKGRAKWCTPSLLQKSSRLCLSPIEPNKSLEGISAYTNKKGELNFYFAFERVERAILHLDGKGILRKLPDPLEDFKYEKFLSSQGRGSASFSGIWFSPPDSLYVIVRNCSAIAKFKINGSLSLESLWSFARILKGRGLWNWWKEESDKEPYGYGMAEGICADENYLYIILDTQNCFCPKGSKDYRTPLLRMRRPD